MILCFVTSRPSYSRVKTILIGLKNLNLECKVVCLASAIEDLYGNIANLIESDGFEVIARLSTQLLSTTGIGATKTTAIGILSTSDILQNLKPTIVITIADRYETIATAISASYQNIPCVHIQGGEVTGNIDDKVRDAVSSLSDYHFPATKLAAERLKKFVKHPENIYNYGCPSVDLYIQAKHMSRIDTIKSTLSKSVHVHPYIEKSYFVVMIHPDTNNIDKIVDFTERLLNYTITNANNIFWFWPNSDPGSERISKTLRCHREQHPHSNLYLVKNLPSILFINLLRHSEGLIGNSSVGVREAGIVGIPTIDIGDRQKSRESHVNCINFPTNSSIESIMNHIESMKALSNKQCYTYGNGNSGTKIANKLVDIFFS